MISIPAYKQIAGITIFRDDVDRTTFFYLPRTPKLLLFPDGKPMFTFLRYQFPLARPDVAGEPGGGYLLLTTALREDQAVLDTQVIPELTRLIRAEDPTAVNAEAKLSPVDFTEGTANLIIMKGPRMIANLSLGSPSLFGDNTETVAAELTSDAATIFFEALTKGLAVAAIEYNLRFPVRLPAITILGHVDASEVKEVVMTYTTDHVTNESVWGDTHTNEEHRTSVSEQMHSQGLIKLEILKGSVEISDDELEKVRAFAFSAMDEFVKKHFLTGGSVESPEDRKSQWMQFIGNDIKATFDLNVSYRDVITRTYNPSAQISPTFLGVPLTDVVQEIDLNNAPWYFNTLTVHVDTNLDFTKYDDLVHSIVGHLSYDQRKDDGTRIAKRDSVVFSKADRAAKKFETRIAELGKDSYHVDVEVNYRNGEKAIIASFDTTTRNLTLSVPNPGVIELTFAAAPKAFSDELKAIEVEIEYADPRNGVKSATETRILDATTPEREYRRAVYAPWDKPFHYRATYVFANQRSTTPWMEGSSGTRYVNINTPFEAEFSLQIIGSADWKEVCQVIVNLDYVDRPNDLRQATSFAFQKDQAQRQQWKFQLRNPDLREYTYTETLVFANGAVTRTPERSVPSDARVLVVGNAPGGVVTIDVDPSDIGVGTNATRVIVRLTYSDPANNALDTETLVFRDGVAKQWLIARADARKNEYQYDVEYFLKDGTRRRLLDQKGLITSTVDYLPLPPVPAA